MRDARYWIGKATQYLAYTLPVKYHPYLNMYIRQGGTLQNA